MEEMTISKAKKMIRAKLKEHGLEYKLTGKTKYFSDLIDGKPRIFITIHDWKPSPLANDLCDIGENYGFWVMFEGPGIAQVA